MGGGAGLADQRMQMIRGQEVVPRYALGGGLNAARASPSSRSSAVLILGVPGVELMRHLLRQQLVWSLVLSSVKAMITCRVGLLSFHFAMLETTNSENIVHPEFGGIFFCVTRLHFRTSSRT